ncbi:MAG: glycoside hydrolase family 2 TIM barrel-domain containing protein [Thermogutta sp.]
MLHRGWCCVLATIACVGLSFFEGICVAAEDVLPLQGTWRFRLDPQDEGVQGGWYSETLPDRIELPGMLQAQGYGFPPTRESKWLAGIGLKLQNDPRFAEFFSDENFLCPFFLTPPRHYVGPAWYQREVEIPQTWAGRRVTLFLERAHWRTDVWVDDRAIGFADSLAAPHVYDLSNELTPGRHRITIRVDNSYLIPVGTSAHSISDETQGNWNGIVGRLELRSSSPVWIEELQIFPSYARKSVEAKITLGNRTGSRGRGTITLQAVSRNGANDAGAQTYPAREYPVQWDEDGGQVTLDYRLDETARPWDEFEPALYQLSARLTADANSDAEIADAVSAAFGFRDLAILGTQFTVNGRPIFLRGTLECCIFPRTGHPPMDVESWRRILATAKSYGLNHLRFHSWCPPEAAFQAADEMGMYYQVECSCWAAFGDGTPVDAFVYSEAARIRKYYGNHPSLLLMAASNEPGGRNRDAFLTRWVETQRRSDGRHAYTAGSGWPTIPANQYHVQHAPRLQAWGPLQLDKAPQTWDDYREHIEKQGIPVVSHEIGQWCAYPNVVSEPEKYTGFFRGSNVEVFREILQRKGLWEQAEEFLAASGRFQVALYKQEIETALRTPGMAGFQLLDLHDFPGQGTAPVGVLDAFCESKGYCSPEEYRRFCYSTVLLARMKKRVFTADETILFQLDAAHYGPRPLDQVVVNWRLHDKERVFVEGELTASDIPTGRVSKIGESSVLAADLPAPAELTLTATLEGTPIENDWKIWIYPKAPPIEIPSGVTLSDDPETAWQSANEGNRVILMVPAGRVAGRTRGTFQPIFWNRITFPTQTVHMVGIVCRPEHPALKDFPTAFHADWQWQELLDFCKPMVLDGLPRELRPIIQPIDDWCDARKLGLVWEARVGKGRLLACSIDLSKNLDERPAARQLLSCLLRYVASSEFAPTVSLERTAWDGLWRTPGLLEQLEARATADSSEPGFEPERAVDGNTETMWHTAWNPSPAPLPHHWTLELRQAVSLRGLRLLPRQDGNPNGQLAECEIQVSDDGTTWTTVAKPSWDNRAVEREIIFADPQKARFLRIVALREIRNQPFASIAEVELIPAP